MLQDPTKLDDGAKGVVALSAATQVVFSEVFDILVRAQLVSAVELRDRLERVSTEVMAAEADQYRRDVAMRLLQGLTAAVESRHGVKPAVRS